MTNLSLSAFLNLSHSGYTIVSEKVFIFEDFMYVWSCTYLCTIKIHLSKHWLFRSPVTQISLALQVKLSRILQNQLALKLPVIRSSTVQCYGFKNFKSGLQGLETGTYCKRKNWYLNCHCSLFSKKNPITQIFCISRWLAIPINPDKWSTTVL